MTDDAPVNPAPFEPSGTLSVAAMIVGIGGAGIAMCTGPIGVLIGLTAAALGTFALIKRRPLPWASGIGLGAGLLAVLLGLISTFAMTMAYFEAGQDALIIKSKRNLRAMAVAMQSIARESPTNLPTPANWQHRLERFLDLPETFVSPFAKPGEVSYAYIGPSSVSELEPSTIVIFENTALSAPNYRALMGDWSVQTFSGDELRLRTQAQLDAAKRRGR